MRTGRFIIYSCLILIAQIILWGLLNLSPYILVSLLPAIILCLPVDVRTIPAMLIAFVTGFVTDLFSSGVLGLTSLALVAVAAARFPVIALVCGQSTLERGDSITTRRYGIGKFILCLLLMNTIFLTIFIWADGAGMRTFWFNFLRFIISLTASTLISVPLTNILTAEESRRWR